MTPILNRDFQHPSDGLYMIEPKGNHLNRRAGVLQVIDEAACEAICAAFNRDAAAPGFAGMLIDHEHFSHDTDKETRAYGWLEALENRADGIYGKIRWTETGRKAVDGGDYRFFSTEYNQSEAEVLTNSEGQTKRIRPLRLDGLTLTNKPNNRKGAKPITNREEKTNMGETIKPGTAFLNAFKEDALEAIILNGDFPGHPFRGNQHTDAEGAGAGRSAEHHSSLAERHSETAHASTKSARTSREHQHAGAAHESAAEYHKAAADAAREEGDKETHSYHAKVAKAHAGQAKWHAKQSEKVKNRADLTEPNEQEHMKDIAKLLGLSEDADQAAVSSAITTLKNRVSEMEAEQVDGLLANHAIKPDDKRHAKLRPVLLTLKNREERDAFLADVVTQPPAKAQPQVRLFNRDTKPPGDAAFGGQSAADAATQAITNRARELKKEFPRMSDATAMITAQRELAPAPAK